MIMCCNWYQNIIFEGRVDPDQELIDIRMNAIKHKILVVSGKGGKYVLQPVVYCFLMFNCFVGTYFFHLCGKCCLLYKLTVQCLKC